MTEAGPEKQRWHWVRFSVPAEYAEEADGWCAGTASCGWQVENDAGPTLTVYFADEAEARRACRELGERLAGLDRPLAPPVSGTVEDRDWAAEWRRSVVPVWVSPRIVVLPSWLSVPARPGLISIVIDPRMAFGTGLHASTRLCLQLLEERLRPGDHCLDLGTGSGVLAIAAARLGASQVLAVDLDPVSVTEAGENLARNGISPEVAQVRQGSVERGNGSSFQMVLANLQSGVLEPLVAPLRRLLTDDGLALFSGLTEAEGEGFIAWLGNEGWRVDEVRRLEGWVGIVAASSPVEKSLCLARPRDGGAWLGARATAHRGEMRRASGTGTWPDQERSGTRRQGPPAPAAARMDFFHGLLGPEAEGRCLDSWCGPRTSTARG